MKKITLLLLLLPSVCFSQKTKSFTLCSAAVCDIFGYIHFDDTGNVIDTTYNVRARDARYTTIERNFYLLKSVNRNQVKSLFMDLQIFLKQEEVGMSSEFQRVGVSVSTLFGLKYLRVYPMDSVIDEYAEFDPRVIKKMLSCLQ